MSPAGPADFTFTFSTIPTPTARPGASWLSYWILGVVCCEGLGQFLWVGHSAPPAWLPAFVVGIPRPLVVGGALGLWQSLVLLRWLKGGIDWWLPTSVGVIVGSFLATHLHPGWAVADWLPGAAALGLVTGFGQWLILRRSLRRSFHWILLCTVAKIGGAFVTSLAPMVAGQLAGSPTSRLLVAHGLVLIGFAVTDGWLLGTVLRGMLGPGNYRGPKLRFPT